MPNFFLHDTRVTGPTPPCDHAIQISPSDSLRSKAQELAEWIEGNAEGEAWQLTLHILCHGTPQGLWLGAPNATQLNAATLFAPLRGKVGNVDIHGCGAAYNYTISNPPAGIYNGAAFCSVLARTLLANVRAADATQWLLPGSSVANTSNRDMLLNWQGNLGTWNSQGRLIGFTTPEQRALQ
jgi:hypothetical protein